MLRLGDPLTASDHRACVPLPSRREVGESTGGQRGHTLGRTWLSRNKGNQEDEGTTTCPQGHPPVCCEKIHSCCNWADKTCRFLPLLPAAPWLIAPAPCRAPAGTAPGTGTPLGQRQEEAGHSPEEQPLTGAGVFMHIRALWQGGHSPTPASHSPAHKSPRCLSCTC